MLEIAGNSLMFKLRCHSANIFSRLTFSWMSEMMHKGTSHTLDEEDLWDLPQEDTAQGLSERLKGYWDAQLEKKR